MAEVLHPGVFIEELSGGVHPIDGVPTANPGISLDKVADAPPIAGVPTPGNGRTGARRIRRFGRIE